MEQFIKFVDKEEKKQLAGLPLYISKSPIYVCMPQCVIFKVILMTTSTMCSGSPLPHVGVGHFPR